MKSYSSSVVQYSNGKDTFTSKKEKEIVNGEIKKYSLDYYINSKKVPVEDFKALLEKKYKALH